DRAAWRFEAAMLRNVEELCQPRILVTAQDGINRMVGDDAGFLLIVSDAAHRPLGVLAGFADTQANSIGRHFLPHPVSHVATRPPATAPNPVASAGSAGGRRRFRRVGGAE